MDFRIELMSGLTLKQKQKAPRRRTLYESLNQQMLQDVNVQIVKTGDLLPCRVHSPPSFICGGVQDKKLSTPGRFSFVIDRHCLKNKRKNEKKTKRNKTFLHL